MTSELYVHGILILAWNCMTRLGDTSDVRYEHLTFETDHIVVVIPRKKADPSATGKSIYADPI